MPSPPRPGRLAAGGLVLCLLLAGCTGRSTTSPKPPDGLPSAEDAAQTLARALAKGDVREVAMTDSANLAQGELQTIMGGMDGLRPVVTPGEISYDTKARTAAVQLHQSLPLGAATWNWKSDATLRWVDDAWKLDWQPQVVQPALDGTTRLRHFRDVPRRAAITGSDGQALVEPTTAYRVGIDKANLDKSQWEATARRLAALLKVDAAKYVKAVQGAGPLAFVPAITLREGQVSDQVKNLKGSSIQSVEVPLAPSTSFAVGLLGGAGPAGAELVKQSKGDVLADDVVGTSGLQKRYDAQLRGSVGHTIEVVPRRPGTEAATASPSPSESASPSAEQSEDSSASGSPETPGPGPEVLFDSPATPGTPVALSLHRTLQERAERALAGQKGVASLVVVKVGTGELLAAANSTAAGANPYATFGHYAPGSTFKVVTALALLRNGFTPASPVACTPTITVDGRSFKNYSDFPAAKVGTISLADALANSCNTAFIAQHARLTPAELAAAAESLGLGKDYDAGYSSYFGSVPSSVPGATTRAANLIGQGTVEASPMAMAGVAASVASGKTVVPWLVESKKPAPANTLTAAEAKDLQQLMRGVVANGSGKVLAGLADGAKTGTAEFGTATPPQTHAWMISWDKDYAIAAFVNQGESGSRSAAPLIKDFLAQG